jgi:hypothetical protein
MILVNSSILVFSGARVLRDASSLLTKPSGLLRLGKIPELI